MNDADPTGLILGIDDFSNEEFVGTVMDAVGGAAVCAFATVTATAIGTPVAGVTAGATCAAGFSTVGYGLGDAFDDNDERWAGE